MAAAFVLFVRRDGLRRYSTCSSPARCVACRFAEAPSRFR